LDDAVDIVTSVQEGAVDRLLHPERYGLNKGIILKDMGRDYTQELDRFVEEYIRSAFSREFPNVGFLGEETEEGPKRKDLTFSWLVDPLDGTSVSATGGVYYSNVIALIDHERGKVPLSSVYQPATGRQFLRLDGEVWISENIVMRDGKVKRIERMPLPSTSAGAPELLGLASIPSKYQHLVPELKVKLDRLFDPVPYPELRNRAYGLKDAKPASGSSNLFHSDIADGNRHFALTYYQAPWDMVGALYAKAAGCIVECGTSLETFTGGDLEEQIAQADKKTLMNVSVFANPEVREVVMKRLEDKSR